MNDPAITLRPVDEIDARIAPRDWAFARDNAARVAAHWRDRLARKPAMFDGRVLLMSSANQVGVLRGLVSAYSQNEVKGTIQRCSGLSQARQWGLFTFRMLVIGAPPSGWR